jgi:arsenate reductase (glutaredoxin)
MAFVLFHNPRCSKSRQALELLEARDVMVTVRRYLDEPLDHQELANLVQALGMTPRQLLRTGEDAYKNLELANPALDDATLLHAMVAHPRLMERPILCDGTRAVVGRPPERVLELL